MKFVIYDVGYRLGVLFRGRVYSWKLPFPLKWGSIKYIWRNKHAH